MEWVLGHINYYCPMDREEDDDWKFFWFGILQ